jgi:GT2 family glycosyltransferase
MPDLLRLLRNLPLLLLSPFLLLIAAGALAVADLLWLLSRPRRLPEDVQPDNRAASIVIPNWNGRELLERYLPSVLAAVEGNSANEVIVVDNGSTDGSAALLRERFPTVRLIALEENLGFGGGSNAGFRAARNDIVVLLNSDMRVEPDFLAPLLSGFSDPQVFAVSCQIFFGDPGKPRQETGLTQGIWHDGALRVRHRIDNAIVGLYPTFYGGGGSCAFDRGKFLELGGFDALLAPFYLEDTDCGYMAWKRGWKLLYQPASVVHHEHRGTIGRHFSEDRIQAVYRKNFILFCWKNIHEWPRLLSHFAFTFADTLVSGVFGDTPARSNAAGIWRAFVQLPQALRSRRRARSLSVIDDTEAFRRPMGGYYRDRFELGPGAVEPKCPNVLLVSPYPICPAVHGGAVFMLNTIRELAAMSNVHVIALVDFTREIAAHDELTAICASTEFPVRLSGRRSSFGSIQPHAVVEFASDDLEWLIHRQIYTRKIDVVQLEYTALAQYAGRYRHIVTALFEHDIYFQSIARGLRERRSLASRTSAAVEYLRALRYELKALPRLDRVQVCSRENRQYLLSWLPELDGRVQEGLRAVIDTSRYQFRPRGREPFTMLFLGSFRHLPNQAALAWFLRFVLPRVVEGCPRARLVVVGSEAPPPYGLPASDALELRGFVDDVREPLARYAVFVCPVLSGSGVRVKLLEAFASGIPAVSTRLGAEGLARQDGEFCALSDDPTEFAAKVIRQFQFPGEAAEMAARARREVETNWDAAVLTRRLFASYQEALREKRAAGAPAGAPTFV